MRTSSYQKLVGTQVVKCSMIEWAEWYYKMENRSIEITDIKGHTRVSTFFDGRRANFVTTVRSILIGNSEKHCTTYTEAVTNHEATVKRVSETIENHS